MMYWNCLNIFHRKYSNLDLITGCKDFSDLMKLDVDIKNIVTKLLIKIGFLASSTIIISSRKLTRSLLLWVFLFAMILSGSFRLLQETFVIKDWCLTLWLKIKKNWFLWLMNGVLQFNVKVLLDFLCNWICYNFHFVTSSCNNYLNLKFLK